MQALPIFIRHLLLSFSLKDVKVEKYRFKTFYRKSMQITRSIARFKANKKRENDSLAGIIMV